MTDRKTPKPLVKRLLSNKDEPNKKISKKRKRSSKNGFERPIEYGSSSSSDESGSNSSFDSDSSSGSSSESNSKSKEEAKIKVKVNGVLKANEIEKQDNLENGSIKIKVKPLKNGSGGGGGGGIGVKATPTSRPSGSDPINSINVRALVHKVDEFKSQFEQKMTKLEILLKEGFKATADCAVQIEKLRADMNLPELEQELGGLPSAALMRDHGRSHGSMVDGPVHPDASDFSDSGSSQSRDDRHGGHGSYSSNDDGDSYDSESYDNGFNHNKKFKSNNYYYGQGYNNNNNNNNRHPFK